MGSSSVRKIADQLDVSLSTVQKELKLIMAICVGVWPTGWIGLKLHATEMSTRAVGIDE